MNKLNAKSGYNKYCLYWSKFNILLFSSTTRENPFLYKTVIFYLFMSEISPLFSTSHNLSSISKNVYISSEGKFYSAKFFLHNKYNIKLNGNQFFVRYVRAAADLLYIIYVNLIVFAL